MSWFHRVRVLFQRRRFERELADEMAEHLELLVEQNIRRGLSPGDARQAAHRAFGGVEQLKEHCRAQTGWLWLENVGRDLRGATRRLARHPGVSLAMVLTLAVALGINAAVVAIARGVLFRSASPAPATRLCSLYLASRDADRGMRPFTCEEVAAVRAARELFDEVGAFAFELGAVEGEGEQRRSLIAFVDEGFFAVHQVQPAAGRFFSAAEAKPGADVPYVVVSAALVAQQGWTAGTAIGRTLRVNGATLTVIGVAPAGFNGLTAVAGPKLWLPLGLDRRVMRRASASGAINAPGTAALYPVVRLREGLTRERAAPALDALARHWPRMSDDGAAWQPLLRPARRFGLGASPEPLGPTRLVVGSALGMALLVLLVACLNLASLQLARGATRRKEVAIRLALGASRGRILTSLLIEDLLVALAGAVVGCALSTAGVGLLAGQMQAALPNEMALTLNLSPDVPAVGLTLLACVVAVLLFGLRPALDASRTDLLSAMRASSASGARSDGPRRVTPRDWLAAVQIGFAIVLVFTAGLFLFGLRRSIARDPGFQTAQRYVTEVDFGALHWSEDRVRRVLTELTSDPGIPRSVGRLGISSALLYGDWTQSMPLRRTGFEPGADRIQEATVARIGPGYFDVLGIPLLRGRDFRAADLTGAGPELEPVVIDVRMAEALYDQEDPIGRVVVLPGGQQAQVVGMCASHWMNPLAERATCWVFLPARDVSSVFLYVRADAPALGDSALAALIRQRLARLDPALVASRFRRLDEVLLASPQLTALVVVNCVFGVAALTAALLGVIGVYAVKSFLVAQRTTEIGLRMALGARTTDIRRMVLGRTMLQAGLAGAAGGGLALLVGRALGPLLHVDLRAVGLLDLGSALGLFVAAMAAAWLPARRAARVDPMSALRCE